MCVCALVCLIDKKVKRQLFEKCATIVTDTLAFHGVYLCAQMFYIFVFIIAFKTIFSSVVFYRYFSNSIKNSIKVELCFFFGLAEGMR